MVSPEKASYLTAYRERGARRRQRRRILIAVLVAAVVAVAGVLVYTTLTANHLTGFRISAPPAGCWRGSVATYQSVTNVSGCGSQDISLPNACPSIYYTSLGMLIHKRSPGNWTLSVTAYVDGQAGITSSVAAESGGFGMTEPCGGH